MVQHKFKVLQQIKLEDLKEVVTNGWILEIPRSEVQLQFHSGDIGQGQEHSMKESSI